MSWSNPLPTASPITGQYAFDVSMSALQAKYQDSAAWATWAATLMEGQLSAIKSSVSTDITTSHINPILASLATVPSYSPGSLDFTNTPFSDSLLTKLRSRLEADILAYNTGLGDTVETAMFARAVSRVNTERVKAYEELGNMFADRGFDVPPGAVSAKQTEITNETALRLDDVNTAILHETATLASNYNMHILQVSSAVVELLGKLNDSQMLRNFEIKKTAIIQALDAYKAQLALYETKGKILADSARLAIDALARTMAVEVESFKGVAQSAAAMVSAAINSVNSSTSFGFGSSESRSSSQSLSFGLTGKIGDPNTPAPALTAIQKSQV